MAVAIHNGVTDEYGLNGMLYPHRQFRLVDSICTVGLDNSSALYHNRPYQVIPHSGASYARA